MKDTLLHGRYRLLEPLASGGEAQVWRSHDETAGVDVAARLALRPGLSSKPETLPAMHEGWVRLLDSGTDPQQGVWQIYELLEGPTLSAQVKLGPLAQEEWRSFAEQSLDAVAALHEAGWVHGDLNAENFIRSGQQWKLLELPFLRFDPAPGRTSLFGSIYTISPEQLNGQPADASSDLYALGCLYYYAAAGEFPHAGASSAQIAIERLRFDPLPLSEKATSLPAAWSTWVMTLLTRDRQNRPPTVAAARHLLGVA